MVRSYKQADCENIRALILSILKQEYPFDMNAYADSDINDIRGTYCGKRSNFFVFEDGNRIVGTAGIKNDDKDTALLRRLFVDPHYRKKGIGTSLVKESLAFCKKSGYKKVVFRATDRMKSAINLIKRHGFIEKEKLEIAGFNIHLYLLKIK